VDLLTDVPDVFLLPPIKKLQAHSTFLLNRILTLAAYYEDKINRKGGDEEQS
jgi:hypothetical protein